ncbi:MAG TPA: HEAT repeat domain-containing protein [Myxococcales bacterium]|jgi:HEAT repeat protein|nr:HEAT repeat domain-containing protein [Myxococcales bacterium]
MGLFSWLGKGNRPEAPSDPAEPESAEDTIEELAEAIASPNGAARVDAARVLIERWRTGDVQAADALVSRLPGLFEDDEPQVRVAALAAVRMMRKPENLERHASAVLALLADRVAQVRTAAVWTAARLPGDVARQQVRALLESTEEPMRFAAACALSDQGDAAALPELTAALREDYRRQEALSSILSLGNPGAIPALVELFEEESLGEFDRTMTAAALARVGDSRGVAHLLERLSSDGDDRPIAAEWVGRLGIADATPILEDLAEAQGDPARGAALRALGRLGAAGARERLSAIAMSPDEPDDLRMDAAEGLAEIGTAAAVETLRGLARGEGELGSLCNELLAEIAANAASGDGRAAPASGTSSESTS